MPSLVGPVTTPVSYRSQPDAFSNVRLPAARGFSMRAMTSGPTGFLTAYLFARRFRLVYEHWPQDRPWKQDDSLRALKGPLFLAAFWENNNRWNLPFA